MAKLAQVKGATEKGHKNERNEIKAKCLSICGEI